MEDIPRDTENKILDYLKTINIKTIETILTIYNDKTFSLLLVLTKDLKE